MSESSERSDWIDRPARPPPPDERARVAYLEVVYGQAPLAIVISVGVLALLCFVLWDASDHSRLVAWFATAVAVAMVRYAVVYRFKHHRDRLSAAAWELRFAGSLVLASVVWGVGGWFAMPGDSRFHQAVVYFFLLGMAGGTTNLYSAQKRGALLAVLGFLTPATVWLALQPDLYLRIMALGGLIYTIMTSRAIVVLGTFIRRSFELSHEVELAREAAERLARTDDLTGILNRRAFYEMGDYLVEQATRHERPISLLLLDVDHFKAINDRHGHIVGDSALRSFAEVLQTTGRKIDVVGRLGGDEFGVLLPDSTSESAFKLAERVRAGLSSVKVGDGGDASPLTCSIGVASGVSLDSLEELMRLADRALYEAKGAGRDRVTGDPPAG